MIEAVEIPAPDKLILRGELRRAGPDWVVLVHDLGDDLDTWRPLRPALAEQGLSVLAFDLRGHGGSDGNEDASRISDDVASAVAFARAAGARRVFLGAAGVSVGPGLEVASREGVDALFAIAPSKEGLPVSASLPRLVVCATGDERQQTAASELRRGSGWSVVAHLPAAETGRALLDGPWRTNVEGYITTFLKDRRLQPRRAAFEDRVW